MIKVYEDKKKAVDFDASIDNCIDRCNQLIDIWHEFQPFKRITTVEDFEAVAEDPAKAFDQLLIESVQLKASGLTADPEQVAKLFSIDRTNYMNLVAGRSVRIDDCIPCQRAKVKAGKTAISLSEYESYKAFVTFDQGEFVRDYDATEDFKKRFTTYATTDAQIAVVNHFADLVRILNAHDAKYTISNKDKTVIAKALHLYLTQADHGEFMINELFIRDNLNR